jgi:hypothetical protein
MHRKPVTSLRQISLEKIPFLVERGLKTLSATSFADVSELENFTVRKEEIARQTDECISVIGQFVFGQLPLEVVKDLAEILAAWLSRFVKNTRHRKSEDRCLICHNILVSVRFSRLFLDPRIKCLDLELFHELCRRELLKSSRKFEGKQVLNLMTAPDIRMYDYRLQVGLTGRLGSILSLSLDYSISNETLISIGRSCPLLENLEIVKCYRFRDSGMESLAGGCKNLKRISFISPSGITIEGFADALLALPKLERLGRGQSLFSILRSVREKDSGVILPLRQFENSYFEVIGEAENDLTVLTEVCPYIVRFEAHVDCPDLTKLSALKHLRSLHLKGLKKGPHHKKIETLLKNIGSQLHKLEIRRCSEVSRKDLENIGNWCPNLETLILQQCSSEDEVFEVKKMPSKTFAKLRVFYFSPYPSTPDKTSITPLYSILGNASNLEEVYIEECTLLSDDFIQSIIESGGLRLLRKFQVSATGFYNFYEFLTMETVAMLSFRCEMLEELGNLNNWNICQKAVIAIFRGLKKKNLILELSADSLKKFNDMTFYS